MAGESPDRSERERSSGETTEDTGSVPSARERDPREAYAAPEEAGDARLRAAVAAWVSGSEPEETTTEEDDSAESSGPSEGAEGAEDVEAEGEKADEEEAPSGLPVRPRKPAPAGSPPTQDTPTTMFGAVRDEESSSDDKESAASRAERMTTAFFGSSRPRASASAEDAEDAGGSASQQPDDGSAGADAATGGADEGEEHAAGAAGEDAPDDADRATAARPGSQRTDEGSSGADSATGEAGGADEGDEHAVDGADSTSPDGRDDVDAERPDPAAETAAQDRPDATDGSTGAAEGADGSDAATEPAESADRPDGSAGEAAGDEPKDQATAVFRAVAPEMAAVGRTDQPTTAIRLPKERAARADAAAPQAGAAKHAEADEARPAQAEDAQAEDAREARGASRFVPLRDGDATRAAGPLPAAEPTGVGGEQERTKPQPVPEPPPLELLAQLTNTPPPPETPLRNAARRVKIWTPLVAVLALLFVIVQAMRPLPEPTLTLTADSTYTFEGDKPSLPWPAEGQAYVEVSGIGVLGSYGEPKSVPIGSVAKTMTAYVVLKEHPLEEGEDGSTITIDKKAEAGGKRGAGNGNESVLDGVKAGDEITLRQAISALMIPSANNIARLLGRWHSGSEAAFVEEMNRTAEELGMEKTHYTDPSGLKESTVSTAVDQVKLGKQVVEMEQLMSITRLPYWENPFTGERMRNWNTLVPYNGAIGIKTGTTTAAGGNLLFAGYEDVGDTRQLIVGAVLGQHKAPIIDTVNAVSRELLIAAGDTLTSQTIVRKGDVVGYLDDGLGGRTPVVATEDVQAVGYSGVQVELALEPGDDGMPHAAPAGEKVGVLTVGGGPGQVEVPVALQKKLTEPGFGDKLTRIL